MKAAKRPFCFFLFVIGFALVATAGISQFDVQGHRGCRGLMPENSMRAFEHAIELGVSTLELDTGVTRDGVVVVYHDSYLNPERVRKNGEFIRDKPLIKDLTLSQLREYDIGRISNPEKWPEQLQTDRETIPTLEEVLELARSYNATSERKVRLNIEIKASPDRPKDTVDLREHVEKVVGLVEEYGLKAFVTIQSFYWKALRLVNELDESITTAALVSSSNLDRSSWTEGLKLSKFNFDIGRMLASIGVDVISPNYTIMTDGWVENAHNAGLEIIPWTVNDPTDMERLLKLGVDGIITDYPDRLLELLKY